MRNIKQLRTTLAIAALVGMGVFWMYWSLRPLWLTNAMVAALHRRDGPTALACLEAGADPRVSDGLPDKRPVLQRLWDSLTGKPAPNHASKETPTMLPLAYFSNDRRDSKHLRLIHLLLEGGVNPDTPDADGVPLMFWVLHYGYKPILNDLLDHGANVNQPIFDGEHGYLTLLMFTCLRMNHPGHFLDRAEPLLAHGADLEHRDAGGQTALMYAAISYGSDEKCVALRYLLAKGANLNAQDALGRDALMYAVVAQRVGAVKMLLAAHSNTRLVDKQGYTARGLSNMMLRVGPEPSFAALEIADLFAAHEAAKR